MQPPVNLSLALTGHDGPVNLAAFSPDGSRSRYGALKTVSLDHNSLEEYGTLASGRMVAILLEPMEVDIPTLLSARPIFAAFSPDGKRVVTASGYAAHLWDQATARPLATMPLGEGVDRPTFSPDGSRILTITYSNSASMWDASTGRHIATLAGHDGDVNSAVFSPDGSRIITQHLTTKLRACGTRSPGARSPRFAGQRPTTWFHWPPSARMERTLSRHPKTRQHAFGT